MVHIKVMNTRNTDGTMDYKGLDLSLIVPGTQLYPSDENAAYLGYDGEIPDHPDISAITEAEHQAKRDEIAANTPVDPVKALQEENAALRQQMAEVNGNFTAFMDFYFSKFPEQA